MGVLSIFKGAASVVGSAAQSANPLTPAEQIVDGAGKIIGMFKLSPDLKAQLQQQLTMANIDMEKAELAANVAQLQGQLAVDQEEAKSHSIFVAGWRPFVGWVCGTALAYAYVIQPLLSFTLSAFHHPVTLPDLNLDTMSTILLGMLGLAGARTVEKVMGVPNTNKDDVSTKSQ